MTLEFLAKGALIGLAMAAPVGPVGVLCIRRTFADGQAAGLVTGLGAATADAAYGAVAAFGLTVVSSVLVGHAGWLQLGGGLFLLALAGRTLLAEPGGAPARAGARSLAQAYATTVFLTLASPATILSFVAVFAGAGLGRAGRGAADAGALVAGVFLGSAAWWLLLSGLVARWRARYPEFAALAPGALGGAVVSGVALGAARTVLRRVNLASGLLLAGFGVAALASAMR